MAVEQQSYTSAPVRGYYGIDELVPAEIVEATVRQIVAKFQPERIILFGSYAYGTPRPGSDIDLLVIVDTPLSDRQSVDSSFSLDMLVRTAAEVRERIEEGNQFFEEVIGKGRLLYERPGYAGDWPLLQRRAAAANGEAEARGRELAAKSGLVGLYDLVPEEMILATARQIADKFKPERIILYGSYADGVPRPGSDVDLAVVMNSRMQEIDQEIDIVQFLRPLFSLDLRVFTPTGLRERLLLDDPIACAVMERGKVLYES